MERMTQNDMVLAYMQDEGSITQLDAIREFGCTRLSARISDLRAMGHLISSKRESRKNRYGRTVSFSRYKLEE